MVIQVRNSSKRVYTPASARESTFQVINRDAVRRRRARVLGRPSPQYAVGQAQRRNTADALLTSVCCRFADMPPLSVEQGSADVLMVEFGLGRDTLQLPQSLRRPKYEDVCKESIADLDPDLADVPLDSIREALQVKGPGMLKQLINMGPITVGSNPPEEVSVVINDASFDIPTHVFAISPLPGNEQNQPPVGCDAVMPIHDVVLASHCVNLPLLKPNKPVRSSKSALITLPVVALCLPSPGMFPTLMAYLYTKRVDALLMSLFPALPSRYTNTQSTSDSVESLPGDRNKSLKLILAETLVRRYNIDGLLQSLLLINGLWWNTRMFGIFDDRLWNAIDFAWAATLTALAISTGNPGLMDVRVSSNRDDQDSAV